MTILEDIKSTFPYKTVMIVDDNKIDRLLVELNVKRYDFAEEIISKGSAKSALEYLESSAAIPGTLPELIFLDIQMPEMDGFGFLDEYEKMPKSITNNCTIMMLSSSLDPKDMERAKKNQFVKKFISKPVNAQILREIANGSEVPPTYEYPHPITNL
jgi:CheY-like chemotaxis protein